MMNTIMWIIECDQYGATDSKMKVENPPHIPRAGDIIDGFKIYGKVEHVHFIYITEYASEQTLVVNVFLEQKK